jgi:hypothetical protein
MIIEGQTVVTASLSGLAPAAQETRRLVDALLDGPGFFVAKGVVPVRSMSAPTIELRAAHSATNDTCAAGGYGVACSCRAMPSSCVGTGRKA